VAGTETGASVRPVVRTKPWAQARAKLLADLGGVGFARHWAATARRPWQQLVDQVATPLRTRLDASFLAGEEEPARHALLDVILGQHDAAWLGAFGATEELAGLARIARSAGWWWAFEHVAILTERPTAIHRDNLGRLHHGDGPALSYPDGYGLHAWRGMPIPAEVAAELPTLTFERVQAETNAEVRRVMLEHFGFERYLRESGAVKAHVDDFGTLWKVNVPGDEPLTMVEVVNGSPEPDGTFRTYFLRVPPRSGPRARAWPGRSSSPSRTTCHWSRPERSGDPLDHAAREDLVQTERLEVDVPDVAVTRRVGARARPQRGPVAAVVEIAQRVRDEVAPAHRAVAEHGQRGLARPALVPGRGVRPRAVAEERIDRGPPPLGLRVIAEAVGGVDPQVRLRGSAARIATASAWCSGSPTMPTECRMPWPRSRAHAVRNRSRLTCPGWYVAHSANRAGSASATQVSRPARFVWIATRSTWDRWDRVTSASRYQDRVSPSPHGVNRIDSLSPSGFRAAQSTNRASASRSDRNCSRLSCRFANGQ
jgi:hypothetical protein